jgi:tRNA pseudouridine38-40 synthase
VEKVVIDPNKIVLVLEYDGANYCGFQFQKNAPSVQGEIEKALFKLTNENTRVVSASRTDSGVHAKGQVACFRTGTHYTCNAYVNGLNFYLPNDIAVKAAYQVNKDFNVQKAAVSREYLYCIYPSLTRSPLKRNYSYLVKGELDIESMNQASQVLVGVHDLASFVTEIKRSVVRSTFREVYSAQVERKGEMVVFYIIARSFLPHQVRNTVGTLIRVGLGKLGIKEFKTILEGKKPGLAGPTVPAQGLYLMKVNYPRPLGEYDEDL